MPKKKRSSMGMSRAAVQGVFSDVFTSDVSSSHYVSHGDASRRETAAFGPDVHAPPPPGLDRSSLHRGGDTVADTLTNIESDLAEPPPIVAVEENGCDTRSFGLQPLSAFFSFVCAPRSPRPCPPAQDGRDHRG